MFYLNLELEETLAHLKKELEVHKLIKSQFTQKSMVTKYINYDLKKKYEFFSKKI